MDVLPLESGAGVKVSLTGGSPCVDGKTMSTTFNFECDLISGKNCAMMLWLAKPDFCVFI